MQNSGLDVMIDGNKIPDFSRLYRLFLMVPAGLPCLKASLKASIARRGKEINDSNMGEDSDVDVENLGESSKKAESSSKGKGKVSPGIQPAINWVQAVLSLKDKFDTVWRDAFQSSREVESTLIEVSTQVVGRNTSSHHDHHFSGFLKLYQPQRKVF
jgi:cullin 3